MLTAFLLPQVPKPAAPTKWEAFAKLKGIEKQKRSRMVQNEATGELAPRFGYKSARSQAEQAEWAIEAPKNAEAGAVDPWTQQAAAKRDRVAKNKKQQQRNVLQSAAKGSKNRVEGAIDLKSAVDLSAATGAPVWFPPQDRMLWDVVWPGQTPDRDLEPGAVIGVGGHELGVLHTPGHSPGCCSFHDATSGVVFSGDTLFCGGPGATGRSYSDESLILASIRDVLLPLPDDTIVHTGHGDSTTIGAERAGVLARIAELGF